MTLMQLQCFYTIALTKSISRAADALFLTQPSVSKHLQQLEQELGFPLLLRSNKGISLTRAGEQMLSHCQQIFEQIEYIKKDANTIRQHIQSHNILRISSVPTLHLYGIIPFFARFTNRYPKYDLILEEYDEDKVLFNLRSSVCDLAFCSSLTNLPPAEYGKKALIHETFCGMMSKKYYAGKVPEISGLKDLKGIPLILDKPESMLFEHCISACRKTGIEPNVKFSSARSLIASQYVLETDACYIGFKSAVKFSFDPNRFVMFDLPEIPGFDFCFFWNKQLHNPALDFFLDYSDAYLKARKPDIQ